jgi:hypothetical protein
MPQPPTGQQNITNMFNQFNQPVNNNNSNNSQHILQQILSNCIKKSGNLNTGASSTANPVNQPQMSNLKFNNFNPADNQHMNNFNNFNAMPGLFNNTFSSMFGNNNIGFPTSSEIPNTMPTANNVNNNIQANMLNNLLKLIKPVHNNVSTTNTNPISSANPINITNKMSNVTNFNFFNNLFNIPDLANVSKPEKKSTHHNKPFAGHNNYLFNMNNTTNGHNNSNVHINNDINANQNRIKYPVDDNLILNDPSKYEVNAESYSTVK